MSPKRNDLLIDAAVAVVIFGGSLGLLGAGAAEDGAADVDALGVLLAALASLPLAARRFAPLGVFVLTALATIALRGVADPDRPAARPDPRALLGRRGRRRVPRADAARPGRSPGRCSSRT